MGSSLTDQKVRVILLDIEGTTTPIDFVYEVLFPYVREYLRIFVHNHRNNREVRSDIEGLWEEYQADARRNLDPPSWHGISSDHEMKAVVAYVNWLMDQDRKSPALKSLQGKIWKAGYQSGRLRGQIYADVLPAMKRWTRQNRDICIFSSGSVLAQKLLFQNTTAGDLSGFIGSHFDTSTGAKKEAESYRRIATALKVLPSQIVFVSDIVEELDAARAAGMHTLLCVRAGQESFQNPGHSIIDSFDEVLP